MSKNNKKAKSKKVNILNYKKLIMLGVLLVAVIICVTATYVTEYNKNKVTAEDVLKISEIQREYVELDEFLENFKSFKVELTEKLNPNEKTDTKGKREYVITVEFEKDAEFENDKFTAKIGLGANWVGYVSALKETTISESNVERVITISPIDHTFPTKGGLWFTSVEGPTVYLLLQWSYDGKDFYTYTTVDIEDTVDSVCILK